MSLSFLLIEPNIVIKEEGMAVSVLAVFQEFSFFLCLFQEDSSGTQSGEGKKKKCYGLPIPKDSIFVLFRKVEVRCRNKPYNCFICMWRMSKLALYCMYYIYIFIYGIFEHLCIFLNRAENLTLNLVMRLSLASGSCHVSLK